MRIERTTKLHKIQIDEFHYIEPDSYSWNLVYEKEHPTKINKKTGQPRMHKSVAYFGTIEDALKFFIDRSLKPSKDLQDVLDRLNGAEKKIEEALGRLNKK